MLNNFRYKKEKLLSIRMSKLEFSLNLPSQPGQLIKLATDYQQFTAFFESQIKNIRILEHNESEIITEEKLVFSTYINHEIIQKSSHKQIGPNQLLTSIISGPFKNSKINITFGPIETGTKVTILLELHVSFKYKLLKPIIKRRYKTVLTGLLYKMNNSIQDQN